MPAVVSRNPLLVHSTFSSHGLTGFCRPVSSKLRPWLCICNCNACRLFIHYQISISDRLRADRGVRHAFIDSYKTRSVMLTCGVVHSRSGGIARRVIPGNSGIINDRESRAPGNRCRSERSYFLQYRSRYTNYTIKWCPDDEMMGHFHTYITVSCSFMST